MAAIFAVKEAKRCPAAPASCGLEGGHDLPILRQEVSGRFDFVAFAVERAVVLIAPSAAS
jgi:hypothetical protein